MEKKIKDFLVLYIIVEIFLILLGFFIYIYESGCGEGMECQDNSVSLIKGFLLPIIFGILAPIIFLIKNYLQKKK